jgi:fermentation-respiration switch protein FrsA (DUF1100 family)
MLVLFLLLSAALVMIFENRIIYIPSRYPEGFWEVGRIAIGDGEIGPSIEDVWMTTEDGVKIHGWFAAPVRAEGEARVAVARRATILFFHGNGGNISINYPILKELVSVPAAVLAVDYRGYGRSEGSPDEEGLYLDARAAWRHLVEERKIDPGRIAIHGQSLGGAVAIDLARDVGPAGLIVESSFTSAPAMARRMLPFPPVWIFVRTRFDSLSKIAEIRVPKLFIHSPSDEMIPFEMGRSLYEVAPEPKEFWEVPGSPHNETVLRAGPEYARRIRGWLDRAVPADGTAR